MFIRFIDAISVNVVKYGKLQKLIHPPPAAFPMAGDREDASGPRWVELMVHEKLKDLKTKKKLTNHKISELSGIPLSTVTKIINGKTDNPSFQSIKDITMAMGGSLDEVAEIQPPIFDQRKDPVEYSAQIELYERIIKKKNRWIQLLFSIWIVTIALILLILLIGEL